MSSSSPLFSLLRRGAVGIALLGLAACVHPADEPTYASAADPIEPSNRYVF